MREWPIIFSGPMVRAILAGRKRLTRRLPTSMWTNVARHVEGGGDARLWVKESLNVCSEGLEYCADRGEGDLIGGDLWETNDEVEELWTRYVHMDGPDLYPTTVPSIHMPRWASRITLPVRLVYLEHLQEISGADAIAEGIDPTNHRCGPGICEQCAMTNDLCPATVSSLVEEFAHLWNSLHAKPGTRWEDNPVIYRIEFRNGD